MWDELNQYYYDEMNEPRNANSHAPIRAMGNFWLNTLRIYFTREKDYVIEVASSLSGVPGDTQKRAHYGWYIVRKFENRNMITKLVLQVRKEKPPTEEQTAADMYEQAHKDLARYMRLTRIDRGGVSCLYGAMATPKTFRLFILRIMKDEIEDFWIEGYSGNRMPKQVKENEEEIHDFLVELVYRTSSKGNEACRF